MLLSLYITKSLFQKSCLEKFVLKYITRILKILFEKSCSEKFILF